MVALLSDSGRMMRPGKPSRAGGDKRGNSASRRARKLWLLSPEASFGGNGFLVPCIYCSSPLDKCQVEADRIIAGGSYARTNIIPACRECNSRRQDQTLWSFAPKVARRLHRRGFIVSA